MDPVTPPAVDRASDYEDDVVSSTAPPRSEPPVVSGRAQWVRGYIRSAALLDVISYLIAGMVSLILRYGQIGTSGSALNVDALRPLYVLQVLLLTPVWVAGLASAGVYDSRIFGAGSEEYRRMLNGAVRVVAGLGVISYAFELHLARLVVLFMVPGALVLATACRYFLRQGLTHARAQGAYRQRVIVVGFENSIAPVIEHLRRTPSAGFEVVGVSIGAEGGTFAAGGEPLPIVAPGRPGLLAAVRAGRADAIAVVNTSPLGGAQGLRQLGWELEGLGVDLMVSPEATEVAGPRVRIVPVNGLALLHVEEPRLSGGARFMKNVVERVLAGVMLVALAPLMLAVALAVRLTSPGPVLFRQNRVGLGGRLFTFYKFRTMVADAEAKRIDLVSLNEADGPLFKIRLDPRVTPLGRFLRRYSIDELPQLWNVVRGDMSIVGPRPPLSTEVEAFDPHVRRRLLVKPGLTGLWQVSGRSDLSWEEAVRLDLHYVDNWTLTQDIVIVARTLAAVLRGHGAY